MLDAPPRPAGLPPRPLRDLTARIPGLRLLGDEQVMVRGVEHDSRQVRPGDLYVARAGERTHGIAHVAEALQGGAAAVLTDPGAAPQAEAAGAGSVATVADPQAVMGEAAAWVYDDPSRHLTVIGVTGTNGKTTTAYLVDAGLRATGVKTGLIGTIETRIGDQVVPSRRTTPEATDLQALLAVMREQGVGAVAMEVSSHALTLGRVIGTRFAVAGFTNLSQDHLDFHGDMASYYSAKAALFAKSYTDAAVISVDDAWGHRLASDVEIPVTTTGSDASAGWRRCDEIIELTGGSARLIDLDGGEHVVRTQLAGRFNLVNAALAQVILAVVGVDPATAGTGIAGLGGIPGRMERIGAGQPFGLIVDYAHTPEAVTTLLEQVRQLTPSPGRVLIVLGCGGDRDRGKRPLMGAAAVAGADLVVLTSDNPRSEDPDEIIAEMLAGIPDRSHVVVEPDRAAAIARAVSLARPSDVVVVAGKGHEQGQEIAGVMAPFDDRDVARRAVREFGTAGG